MFSLHVTLVCSVNNVFLTPQSLIFIWLCAATRKCAPIFNFTAAFSNTPVTATRNYIFVPVWVCMLDFGFGFLPVRSKITSLLPFSVWVRVRVRFCTLTKRVNAALSEKSGNLWTHQRKWRIHRLLRNSPRAGVQMCHFLCQSLQLPPKPLSMSGNLEVAWKTWWKEFKLFSTATELPIPKMSRFNRRRSS